MLDIVAKALFREPPKPYTKEYYEEQWNYGAKLASFGDPYRQRQGFECMKSAALSLNEINERKSKEIYDEIVERNRIKIEIPITEPTEIVLENHVKSLFPKLNLNKDDYKF